MYKRFTTKGDTTMIVDEATAKTKWCPMSRVCTMDGPCNKVCGGAVENGTSCLASGCMAWEWSNQAGCNIDKGLDPICCVDAGRPDDCAYGDRGKEHCGYWVTPEERKGCCGLAAPGRCPA